MLVLNCSTKLLILENMLRSYFPESLKVYGAVMNINRGNPFQKEVVLDAWPDFKAVITRRQREADTDNLDHYTNAYAVFYKDATAYRQLLEEHGVINWDQVFQIQGLQSELCDVSKAVANSKQLDVKLTSFKAVHFPPVSSLPDTSFLLGPPPRLTSLSVSDAELLDRTWSRGGNEQCLRYLARLLSCFPSACVRDDRGDPVSWALTDQFATMCHGYTLPDHRRRGYSRVVALTLARKLQSRGFPAQGNVLDDNLASINLLQSVGIEPFLPVVRFYCTQRADSRQGPPREPGPSVGCKPRKSGFSRPGSHLRACTAQSPWHGGTAFGVDRKSFRTVGTNHIMNPKLPSSKRGQDFEPLRLLCPSPSGTKDGGPESPGARESPGLCLRPGARGVLSRVLGPSPGTPAPGASGPRVPGPGKSPLSSGPPEGAAGRGGPGRGYLGAEPRGPGRAGAPPPSAGSPADPGPADLLPSRVAASGPLGPFQVAAGARGGLPRGAGGPAHGVGLGPGHHEHGGARPERSHFPRQPGLRRPWGAGDLTPPGPSCQHPGQDPPRVPGEQRGPMAPRVSDHPEGERPSRACPDPREEAARRPGWARGWRARLALSTTHPKRHHPGPSVPTLLTLALGLVWNWSRVERCERLELATTEERLDRDC